MEWVKANVEVLNFGANVLIVLIWLFYAQLLFQNYRRQRRPVILINQGVGTGLASRCLICNMSEEAIYISLVLAELESEDGRTVCSVTDTESDGREPASISDATRQGPLKAGDFRDIGSFRPLLERTLHSAGWQDAASALDDEARLTALSIHVVGVYGSENRPVGASRRFDLSRENGGYRLRPASVDTDRLSSLRQRRRIRRWLADYL